MALRIYRNTEKVELNVNQNSANTVVNPILMEYLSEILSSLVLNRHSLDYRGSIYKDVRPMSPEFLSYHNIFSRTQA